MTGKGGEVWLTEAVCRLIKQRHVIMAPTWKGSIWTPNGDPILWLKANILTALNDSNFHDHIVKILNDPEILDLVNYKAESLAKADKSCI